jgi:hypothetical protein
MVNINILSNTNCLKVLGFKNGNQMATKWQPNGNQMATKTIQSVLLQQFLILIYGIL